MKRYPSYLELLANGELEQRVDALLALLESCTVCPRNCRVKRHLNKRAVCQTGRHAEVASWCVHRGEEPYISGSSGSGTVFFAHCNLACVYCQNFDISQNWPHDLGLKTAEELADIYLELQYEGVHNLNWVSPSHVVPQAVEALVIAARRGLRLPLVFNSGGYDSIETLRLLEGIVDIYMPDLKYASEGAAAELSQAVGYVPNSRAAIREMYRQVGSLQTDGNGVAIKGLLVRHLVLPNNMSQTEEVMKFLSGSLGKDVTVSLLSQYYPYHEAHKHASIAQSLSYQEFSKAVEALNNSGLKGYVQGQIHR